MGHFIIKIKDRYFDWSSVVDAPITNSMTKKELETYHREEYGRAYHRDNFEIRMKRVEETGTSVIGQNLNQVLILNRAGDHEEELTEEEIYEMYTDSEEARNE